MAIAAALLAVYPNPKDETVNDVIEFEAGIRFSPATLDREIKKSEALLAKTSGKRIDGNTSRDELEAWRDRCVAAQERRNRSDVSRVETLEEAQAWDAKVNYLKRRGLTHEEATKEAWRWANQRAALEQI